MRLIDGDFFQQKTAIKIISSMVLELNKKKLLAKVFIHNTHGILMIVNDLIKFLCLEKVFDDSFFSIRLLNKMGRLITVTGELRYSIPL